MITRGRQSRIREVAVATPAVNAVAVFTVPAGALWEIVAGYYTVATVAVTGAARIDLYVFNSIGDTIYEYVSSAALGAGQTGIVSFGVGMPFQENTTIHTFMTGIAPLVLLPDSTLNYGYLGNTGDIQIGQPKLMVKETLLGY